MTRATFGHALPPDWVSLEAPPSTRTIRPPRTRIEHTFQNDKSLIDTQSDSLCTSEPRGSIETSVAALATTHIPQVQLDRVLLCECDHRADELIGLKVDVSGEFIAEFELVFIQEP